MNVQLQDVRALGAPTGCLSLQIAEEWQCRVDIVGLESSHLRQPFSVKAREIFTRRKVVHEANKPSEGSLITMLRMPFTPVLAPSVQKILSGSHSRPPSRSDKNRQIDSRTARSPCNRGDAPRQARLAGVGAVRQTLESEYAPILPSADSRSTVARSTTSSGIPTAAAWFLRRGIILLIVQDLCEATSTTESSEQE